MAAAATSSSVKSEHTSLKFADLKEKLVHVYNVVNEYVMDERDMAYPFRHLPSRADYPDYYQVIKKPIDMARILHKINTTGGYSSLDDMCVDFAQMFENACVYNEPASTLYKDALTLQRLVFETRDAIYAAAAAADDPSDTVKSDAIRAQVHEIIEQLFDACLTYQDMEGRVLSDSFLHIYSAWEATTNDKASQQQPPPPPITFDVIGKRVASRTTYTRLDAFQDDMFALFDEARERSYLPPSPSSDNETAELETSGRIHRFASVCRDAHELQRYYIQRRDELCRNGDRLLSAALSFKAHGHSSSIDTATSSSASFDEAHALLVEQRYRPLEAALTAATSGSGGSEETSYQVGSFYYIKRAAFAAACTHWPKDETKQEEDSVVVCCLLAVSGARRAIAHLYVAPSDDQLVSAGVKRAHKFLSGGVRELLKSDMYALVDDLPRAVQSQCAVISVKDHICNEVRRSSSSPTSACDSVSFYVCESMFSSRYGYMRKLVCGKKWSPVAFISNSTCSSAAAPTATVSTTTSNSFMPGDMELVKRAAPLVFVGRSFLDEASALAMLGRVEEASRAFYLTKRRLSTASARRESTVELESAPKASAGGGGGGGDDDADEHADGSMAECAEMAKAAKYYEQVAYRAATEEQQKEKEEEQVPIYKLGDYVYVRRSSDADAATKRLQLMTTSDMIVRIDRLWSTSEGAYWLRGPLFLRPAEIDHEPTRLFYRNEVFRELARQVTAPLERVLATAKCVVMNAKQYATCRHTQIDERHVFVCDAKYSVANRTFRKFTKGLKKFELSLRCYEDEILFLKRELHLRKHLSPLLVNMQITYDEDQEAAATADADNNATQVLLVI